VALFELLYLVVDSEESHGSDGTESIVAKTMINLPWQVHYLGKVSVKNLHHVLGVALAAQRFWVL